MSVPVGRDELFEGTTVTRVRSPNLFARATPCVTRRFSSHPSFFKSEISLFPDIAGIVESFKRKFLFERETHAAAKTHRVRDSMERLPPGLLWASLYKRRFRSRAGNAHIPQLPLRYSDEAGRLPRVLPSLLGSIVRRSQFPTRHKGRSNAFLPYEISALR